MGLFCRLGLGEAVVRGVEEAGYTTPTEIQERAITPVLEGRDLLGKAGTGTGKTAAFGLPLLDLLVRGGTDAKTRRRGPRALILAPTRELAEQIAESLAEYGRHTGVTGCVIVGGVSQNQQEKHLRRGVDVIVATPGRLIDLLEQGVVELGTIEMFVLDEADRMLDMGFIHPIRRIAEQVSTERQTLLFSATMPPAIRKLSNSLMRNPVTIEVEGGGATAEGITQTLHHVDRADKPALLERLLDDIAVTRAVVFIKTKHGADKLARRLAKSGVEAASIHGNKTQGQRRKALDQFRSGRARVLVATDVAARGLDVDGVSHVFNYNLPMEAEAYVHRIGRTGRAGAVGEAVSFCEPEERKLLRAIEQLTGERIPLHGNQAQPARPRTRTDSAPAPRQRIKRSDLFPEEKTETRSRPPRGRGKNAPKGRPNADSNKGGPGRRRRKPRSASRR